MIGISARLTYKTDESFLEKVSMGAIGTDYIFQDLKNQGHNPIELERGSRSFKIWKEIKVKRFRIPDILCIDCSKCFESRAKTNFEISMSHSFVDPERGWNSSLSSNDYVAIVVCERSGERPIDWKPLDPVQYISANDMIKAQNAGKIYLFKPKGATEGYEARIKWPTSVASYSGTVTEVSESYVKYKKDKNKRIITLQRDRRKGKLKLDLLVKKGDRLVSNQVLASVVPVIQTLPCEKNVTSEAYLKMLESPNSRIRYTACKALAEFPGKEVIELLRDHVKHPEEETLIRLEAARALATKDDDMGWQYIQESLSKENLQYQLEAVTVLAEVDNPQSSNFLCDILRDTKRHFEIRAGAAWALGELKHEAGIDTITEILSEKDEQIYIEGVRALGKMIDCFTDNILEKFVNAKEDVRPGVAWALTRSKSLTLEDLISTLRNEDTRHWIAYVIGMRGEEWCIREIEKLRAKDPEVYFGATLLWKLLSSWVFGLEEYG